MCCTFVSAYSVWENIEKSSLSILRHSFNDIEKRQLNELSSGRVSSICEQMSIGGGYKLTLVNRQNQNLCSTHYNDAQTICSERDAFVVNESRSFAKTFDWLYALIVVFCFFTYGSFLISVLIRRMCRKAFSNSPVCLFLFLKINGRLISFARLFIQFRSINQFTVVALSYYQGVDVTLCCSSNRTVIFKSWYNDTLWEMKKRRFLNKKRSRIFRKLLQR